MPEAAGWTFEPSGPLSSANGALCWMVFRRDRADFETRFRRLSLERYQPHTPLRYWLSGGLKRWTLLPRVLYPAATALDCALAAAWPDTGSFVDVELVRRPWTDVHSSRAAVKSQEHASRERYYRSSEECGEVKSF